jgi:hypothetical protein
MTVDDVNERWYAEDFYNPFDAMSFTYDRCFICGHVLGNRKSTECVFPKWLQQEFSLANKRIRLLNRTAIPYRKLTAPCCLSCNTNHLAKVENAIKRAYKKGFSEFARLDRLTIFQWTAKLFYGLLFKELSLQVKRSDPALGFITDPEFLNELKTFHAFLESARTPHEFVGFHPWSIFLVETRPYGDGRDFDYHDGVRTLTFSIRMGEIGIIACLQDNGAQEELLAEYFDKFKGIRLHPVQFDELVARVEYRRRLMNRTPKYFTVFPKRQLSLQGFSFQPIFDDWNQKEYARHLVSLWSKYGIRFEDVFREPDIVLSNLINEDGTIRIMDIGSSLSRPWGRLD